MAQIIVVPLELLCHGSTSAIEAMEIDMTITATAAPALRFERETCSRCGGCGEYSYCEMYGRTCFKCGGKRETLTRRAQVAAKWMNEQNLVPASEVQIGMRIKCMGITITVREIEAADRGSSLKEGVMVKNPDGLRFTGQSHGLIVDLTTMVQVIRSQDDQRALLARAIEYQNSLTKEGKPRKRAA